MELNFNNYQAGAAYRAAPALAIFASFCSKLLILFAIIKEGN
jgi:hypothetical protein